MAIEDPCKRVSVPKPGAGQRGIATDCSGYLVKPAEKLPDKLICESKRRNGRNCVKHCAGKKILKTGQTEINHRRTGRSLQLDCINLKDTRGVEVDKSSPCTFYIFL